MMRSLSTLVPPLLVSGSLGEFRARPAFPPCSPVAAVYRTCVGFVIGVPVAALGLARAAMSSMRDAVKLIGAVVPEFEVLHAIDRRVRVRPMIHLKSLARPYERCIDKAVHQMPPQQAVLLQANAEMPTLPRLHAEHSTPVRVQLPVGAPGGVRGGPDPSEVGHLIEPITLNWSPRRLRHNAILSTVRRGYRWYSGDILR